MSFFTDKPEYLNKKFLLSAPDFSGLLSTTDGENILLEVDKLGNLKVSGITTVYELRLIPDISLQQLGEQYLKLRNPAAQQILKYLILPEMEVERIFNCVRYNYLTAVYLSNFKNPRDYFNAKYNRAFQSLAGLEVTQTPGVVPKDNDSFWRDAGFSQKAKELDWDKELRELKRILGILKIKAIGFDYFTLYKELIAIKPGVHELLIHHDYFEKIPSGDTLRDSVFRMLRGGDYSGPEYLDELPVDMDFIQYYRYAPCHVTEGPFISRKKCDGMSCFKEISKIDLPCKVEQLNDTFYVYNYFRLDVNWDEIQRFRYYRHTC